MLSKCIFAGQFFTKCKIFTISKTCVVLVGLYFDIQKVIQVFHWNLDNCSNTSWYFIILFDVIENRLRSSWSHIFFNLLIVPCCMPDSADKIHYVSNLYPLLLALPLWMHAKEKALPCTFSPTLLPLSCFFKRKSMFLAGTAHTHSHKDVPKLRKGEFCRCNQDTDVVICNS